MYFKCCPRPSFKVAICDQFSFILMFYIIRHISIFIFEITNCDLKRVVTYYCIQKTYILYGLRTSCMRGKRYLPIIPFIFT